MIHLRLTSTTHSANPYFTYFPRQSSSSCHMCTSLPRVSHPYSGGKTADGIPDIWYPIKRNRIQSGAALEKPNSRRLLDVVQAVIHWIVFTSRTVAEGWDRENVRTSSWRSRVAIISPSRGRSYSSVGALSSRERTVWKSLECYEWLNARMSSSAVYHDNTQPTNDRFNLLRCTRRLVPFRYN
ncbi:hypothetical protein BDZ89DRAFT_1064177 [Hymenopellis radicata]|nr:hypothetical protein BDZ89DRAFT_1064177 [Hymenopellis radicata]